MRRLLALLALFSVCATACGLQPAEVDGARCPRLGFVEVVPGPSVDSRPLAHGGRTIHVRRQPLTTTGDIADIELQDWYGDAQIRFHYINDTEPLRRECLDRESEGERYS